MKKQGWDVHIITNRYPRSLPGQECLDGIKIFRYFFFHTPLNYIRNRRPDLFFAWLIMKPVTLFKLLIHFFRTRPDVVNLHFPDQQLFECYLLKLMFRFKLIISLHGNEVERMGILKKRTLRYYFYEKLFYSAEYITGCSKYLLDEFQKIFPQIKSAKYFTIHINSCSSKTVVYKGLFTASLVSDFYWDLRNPLFKTRFGIFHQRFSTNTSSSWDKAQPFRMLAHNGEINTIQSNFSWMKPRENNTESEFWGEELEIIKPFKEMHPISSFSVTTLAKILQDIDNHINE